ncbi:hypothetical protein B296_00032699 [Ensete ventricosum]|uniref:Uncharacterized protein n=1 Tax=Ensete ventricosum TaxID=4639 RepID=A0A426YT89_ENSVE|nr:hypothetical protein B296_00032699 [Ensete ventricosum]
MRVAVAALHVVGMGSPPCGRRCYPRVAPPWRAVPPYVSIAPAGAASLAGGNPGHGATPYGLAAGTGTTTPETEQDAHIIMATREPHEELQIKTRRHGAQP